ncbi:MAG: pyrroline-5-carboxylate reductase [Burkholderiaceae bacterium]
MRITFVGAGNMASALIGGLLANGHQTTSIQAVDPSDEQRRRVAGQFGIRCHARLDDAAESDVLVLAVKPQAMAGVVRPLAGRVDGRLVISVAAGIRASDLSRWLGGHRRIVRAMPNTPALIGMGVTGMAAMAGLADADRRDAQEILAAVGGVVWVEEESLLDAVTAVSGSGPAYVFYFMEQLESAGCAAGLSPAQARALTLATFRGAAELANRSDEPLSVLRERVTSKGGTTAAALAVLGEGAVADGIERGVAAASRRSQELGDEFGSAD